MLKLRKTIPAIACGLLLGSAQADNISGVAEADFDTDTLVIPCVEVKNLDPLTDGSFFDIVLERQEGGGYIYELKLATVEDSTYCQSVADYAHFEDDDFQDDDDDIPGNSGTAKLFLKCELRSDRSKISADGKDLSTGSYYVSVSAGPNTAQSPLADTVGDEVEFDFDSEMDDILSGDIAIDASFVQAGQPVEATIFDADDNIVVSATATCLER